MKTKEDIYKETVVSAWRLLQYVCLRVDMRSTAVAEVTSPELWRYSFLLVYSRLKHNYGPRAESILGIAHVSQHLLSLHYVALNVYLSSLSSFTAFIQRLFFI